MELILYMDKSLKYGFFGFNIVIFSRYLKDEVIIYNGCFFFFLKFNKMKEI